MALKLNYTATRFGAAFPEAYARVASVRADKLTSTITVEVYTDAACGAATAIDAPVSPNPAGRVARIRPIETLSFRLPTPQEINGGLIPFVYNYLKTLPEFSECTDC